MKCFAVIISPSAEADILDSFIWGCDQWGVEAAQKWARNLRSNIVDKLSVMPLRYPVAPETEEIGIELRQMTSGRYRILFRIEMNTVRVAHVRGAFDADEDEE